MDFLGWHEQGDGKLFLGISVENGRIKDEGSFQLKKALRKIIDLFKLPMLLTPNHNIILYGIEPRQQQAIEKILAQHDVRKEKDIDPLVRYSIACPAFPTCGLAITESERALPGILGQIRLLLDKVGLVQEDLVIRMTGCPNGCARPYMAELGFVGSAPDAYQIWLGGSPNQTRLAKPYIDKLHINNLEAELEAIFVYFKQQRQPDESFGDFCNRVGIESIHQFVTNYQSSLSMNTDINNSTFTSINSENNTPAVTDATATTPETKSQEEGVTTNEENNQVNPLVTLTPHVDSSPSINLPTTATQLTGTNPATNTTQLTGTNPPITNETQPVKTLVSSEETNTSQPVTSTIGQEVSQPELPPEKPKDTSKMRHRVSVRDEIYTLLREESKRQGKPVVQLATEAIAEYLERIRKNESLTTTDEI